MLFESFEAYDVQETRRVSKAEGEELKLIKQVCKKIQKKNSVSEIADMLEEEKEVIREIYDISIKFAPDYDAEKILEELHKKKMEK